MANIPDDKLNKLIDKISKLTIALENMPLGEGRGRNDMFPFWRMRNNYDAKGSKKWKDLSSEEKGKYERMKKDMVNAIDEEIEKQKKNINRVTISNSRRKSEIDNECRTIESKLRDPRTLLTERQRYNDRLNELNKEESELKKKLNEEIKKEQKLRKQRNIINSKSSNEFYGEQSHGGPKEGTKKAWRRMSRDEQAEYGSFESYRQQAVRNRASSNRQDASRLIYENNMGDNAFGRYAQSAINRRQRLDDYANMGRILQGSGGKKIATAMFGSGKAGATAAKALGGFGKGLTVASKALGKFVPGLNILLAVIDILHGVGDAVGEWKKHNASIIKYQTQYEKLTYEHDKQIANLQAEQQVIDIGYEKDIQMKMLDVQGQNMLEAVGLQNRQIVNSVSAAVGGITQGITVSAYQAANNMVDYQADYLKYQKGKETREGEQTRYNAVRQGEYYRDKALNEAEKRIADVDYETGVAQNALEKEHFLQDQISKAASLDTILSMANPLTMGSGISNITAGVAAFTNTDSRDTGTITDGGRSVSWKSTDNGGNPITGESYAAAGRINDNGFGSTALTGLESLLLGDGIIKGKQAEESAQLENAAQSLKQAADWNKQAIENYYKVSLEEQAANKELIDKQAELSQEAYNLEVEKWAEIKKMWLEVAQKIELYWQEVDAATNRASLNQGILEKGDRTQYQKYLQTITNTVASYYGKTAVEVAASQTAYSEATGRNKTLGSGDYEKLYYMGTRLGDDNLAAQYGADMEIFNHGVENSVDMLDEALDNVNRIGLNGKKYSKDLVNNLKLAHKYNFKGGTKELMEMAKWAQQTRFNLSSLSSIIDKVQQGGIEGVITQAAGFQVLGGHAAINSDPLGMLYDAWADPQAYAKRMQDMTKGFGRFDAKTGETKFNINESMQIAQMAKLQGRSAEELRDEIMQRNKATQVEKQINNYERFDEEQKAMITNKAEYVNGTWQVKMNNGKMREVSSLSKSDLDNLMPKGHEERMEALQREGVGYLREIVDYQSQNKGEEEREKGITAITLWEQMQKETEERIKNMADSFIKNFETNTQQISNAMTTATKNQEDYLSLYYKNAQNIAAEQQQYTEAAGRFNESLTNLTTAINNAINKINGTTGVTHQTPPPRPSTVRETPIVERNDSTRVVTRNSYEFPDDFNDGITSGDGKPMLVSAKSVTSVQDGTAQIAKTDPNDTALFAKSGGPFDKLFDGIFGRVNTIYNEVVSNRFGGDVRSASTNSVSNVYDGSSLVSNRFGGDAIASPTEVSLTITGKIELAGQNGQSIDIMEQLKQNPMFVRQITEMIVRQMNNNTHGGRNDLFPDRFSSH